MKRVKSTNSTRPSSASKSKGIGSELTKLFDSSDESLILKKDKADKARWTRIKRVYGLSKDEYEALDKGGCPICLRPWGGSVRPAVDHDHVDGWVRGIVCLYCNRTRIGRFRDSGIVRRIADYLDGPFQHRVPDKKKRKRKVKKP